MPSFFDVDEILTISKYSIINAAIHKIEKNGYIILSDLKIKEILKQRISSKSKRARMKIASETFAIKHTFGSIFDSEVINVSEKHITIKIGDLLGIIKRSELTSSKVDKLDEICKIGDRVKVVYIRYSKGKLLFGLYSIIYQAIRDINRGIELDMVLSPSPFCTLKITKYLEKF